MPCASFRARLPTGTSEAAPPNRPSRACSRQRRFATRDKRLSHSGPRVLNADRRRLLGCHPSLGLDEMATRLRRGRGEYLSVQTAYGLLDDVTRLCYSYQLPDSAFTIQRKCPWKHPFR